MPFNSLKMILLLRGFQQHGYASMIVIKSNRITHVKNA